MLDDKGHMTPQDVERDLGVDVALRWGTGYDTELRSFVNVIATPKGGTHVAGFEQAVTKTFNEVLKATTHAQGQRARRHQGRRARGADRGRHRPAGRAAVRGPDQGGARHPGGARIVTKVVAAELKKFLTSTKRAEKAQAKLVLEKVANASRTRIAARTAPGDPAPQERAGVQRAARPSSPTAAPTTWSAASCSSSRATRRSAPPSWPATPSSRRCCRSAARSSTSRRRRSATC